MALLTFVVVVTSAAGGWWLLRPAETVGATPGSIGATAQAVIIPSELVQPGKDYYAHVKLIELQPSPAGGGSWEGRSASAPDICFTLSWNGTLIFTGAERSDRLIGEWDLLRLDLKDALLSGQVEVASAVNAPIVRVEAGGILTVEIWDEDAVFDDEAGKLDLPVEMLKAGINTLTPGESGVARIVLDMVPRDTSLPDLLERASNR